MDISRLPAHTAASPAEQTRRALVVAALRLFGQHGFDATSTRQIAALAQANIGSIAYHFGGKEGLRVAVADFVVETIGSVAGPALAAAPEPAAMAPAQAEALLMAAAERMVGFILSQPEAGEIVAFVQRELGNPSPALDRLYTGLFEPVHRRLCAVWSAATGEDAESETTRITVFTLIGQLLYFRIARPAVQRRLGWDEIGAAEAAAIAAVARANIAAILAAHRSSRP